MHRFSFWSTCSFAMEKIKKKKKGRRNIHLGWDRKKIRDERRKKEKKKNWFESVSRIVQFSGSMWGRTWCFARGVLSFFFISLLFFPLVQLPFHVSFPFRSFLLYSCRQAWSSVVLLPRFTAIGIVAIAVLTDLGYVVSEILGRLRAELRQAYQRRLSQIY